MWRPPRACSPAWASLHLEVIAKKLASKFGAECLLQFPKIPYRESIRKKIDVQGRHKKQSGGHGQFGDVWIEFRPNDDPTDTEFHFEDAVVGAWCRATSSRG